MSRASVGCATAFSCTVVSIKRQGPLSYNERYKHFERLIVLGFHLALWWAHDAGGGPGGQPSLSEDTEDTTNRSAGWRFAD
jgi:hypothetical protein